MNGVTGELKKHQRNIDKSTQKNVAGQHKACIALSDWYDKDNATKSSSPHTRRFRTPSTSVIFIIKFFHLLMALPAGSTWISSRYKKNASTLFRQQEKWHPVEVQELQHVDKR